MKCIRSWSVGTCAAVLCLTSMPQAAASGTPHDSTLSELTVYNRGVHYGWNRGTLNPPFSKSTLIYTDTVENAVEAVAVGGSTLDTTNTVTYAWGGIEYGSVDIFGLAAGVVTPIFVKVTNVNGDFLEYKIGVFRKRANIPWSPGIAYGTLGHHGQSYKTVQIGAQTWMAENLNDSGASGKTGKCFLGNKDFCIQYGRLYSWAETMGFDDSCNTKSCSAQVVEPMQGLCPTGWHVPSDKDWATLMRYVDALRGSIGVPQEVAGWVGGSKGDLQAVAGWDAKSNGKDAYGFRALPGGLYHEKFNITGYVDAGATGYWWSASEVNANYAWYLRLYGSGTRGISGLNGFPKVGGSSLRCVQTTNPMAYDSTLSDLVVSGGGVLSPPFSKSTFLYTDTVENAVSYVTVTGTTLDATNVISYMRWTYCDTVKTYGLQIGHVAPISVRVTNLNGNFLEYKVGVYRKGVSIP